MNGSSVCSRHPRKALERTAGSSRHVVRPTEADHILTQIRRRVFRQALASTGDPDSAEDICQEVLLLVLRGLSSFKGEARVSSWVYRITKNVIQGFFRREAYERRARGEWDQPDQGSWADQPLDHLIDRRSLWDMVEVFSDQLPFAQREALAFTHFQGFRSAEVARASGRCPGTIRANLHRARKKIRERMWLEHPRFSAELLE